MKTLAVILGSVFAALVITIGIFVIYWLTHPDPDEYSRGDAYVVPPAKAYIYRCERASLLSYC